MQWVSTFAYGASSLGRSRRLEVRPAESGPPSSRGKFGENSPHLLGNIEKGKSKKVFSGEARHSLGLVVPAFLAPRQTRPSCFWRNGRRSLRDAPPAPLTRGKLRQQRVRSPIVFRGEAIGG